MQTVTNELEAKGKASRAAARKLATVTGEVKNAALLNIADSLEHRHESILAANEIDIENARKSGLTESLVDRLLLNPERLSDMAAGVRSIANLNDPVGEMIEMGRQPGKNKICWQAHCLDTPAGEFAYQVFAV